MNEPQQHPEDSQKAGCPAAPCSGLEECPSSRNSWRAAFDPNYGHWYVVSDNAEVAPTKANAHLMAAAPELLEALHKLEAWSAMWTDADNGLRVKARAAISRVMEGLNI